MEAEPTPSIDEITGSIAYELEETFKSSGIKVQSYDDLGDIEMKFPDGKAFRVEIIEMEDGDLSTFDDDEDA